MEKDKKDNMPTKGQLNVIIALLLAQIGEQGRQELFKKRRANKEIIQYLSDLGLKANKDLASIFNTTEQSISNLKTKKKSAKKRKKK